MMGTATTTLPGVTATRKAPATGDAGEPQEGGDSFGALLGAAPAAPGKSASPAEAAATHASTTAAKQDDADAKDDANAPVEIAAMIAALLAAAGAAPAATTSTTASAKVGAGAGAVGTNGNAASTDADSRLAQGGAVAAQLQDLLDAARASATAAAATATSATTAAAVDATADKPAPDAELQQLLQARGNSTAAKSTDASADIRLDTSPLASMLAQLSGETAGHAHDVAAVVAAAGATQLDADTLQAQSQSSTQPQAATLAPTPLPQPASTATTQTIQAPVGTPRWADELGSRMVMMNLRGQHEGSLTLTPDHLGPLEVRLSVNQGTASVWFGSQHADTRAALTEALPRLREMFADAGLLLGHAGVSQEAPRQGARNNTGTGDGAMGQGISTDAADITTQPVTRRVALGLVDTYA